MTHPVCDCHIHMVLDGVYWKDAIARHRSEPDEGLIRAVLARYQAGGVTRIRDGGDVWGVCLAAKRLAAEYGIDYRTPAFPIHKKGRYGAFIGRSFDTFAEFQKLVREAKAGGADFIKVMFSGLMDFDHYGVITSEPLTAGEMRDMVSFCHDEDLAVMAHVNGSDAIRNALSASVDSVEHGAYFDEEGLCQLAQSSTVWVPTLVTIANLIGNGRFPDPVLKPLLETQMASVQKAASLGVSIAVGSDAGAYQVFHGDAAAQEYDLLSSAIGAQGREVLERGNGQIFSRF